MGREKGREKVGGRKVTRGREVSSAVYVDLDRTSDSGIRVRGESERMEKRNRKVQAGVASSFGPVVDVVGGGTAEVAVPAVTTQYRIACE